MFLYSADSPLWNCGMREEGEEEERGKRERRRKEGEGRGEERGGGGRREGRAGRRRREKRREEGGGKGLGRKRRGREGNSREGSLQQQLLSLQGKGSEVVDAVWGGEVRQTQPLPTATTVSGARDNGRIRWDEAG